MLHYISKGEIFVQVPPKQLQCIFHDYEEGITAFAIREKEGSQLSWAFQHLFQNMEEKALKDWVTIKTILPIHPLYESIYENFKKDNILDVNEPIYCFQFCYLTQLDETLFDNTTSVFLLRRFKNKRCNIKFEQI